MDDRCVRMYQQLRQLDAETDGPRVFLGVLSLEKDAEQVLARRTAVRCSDKLLYYTN